MLNGHNRTDILAGDLVVHDGLPCNNNKGRLSYTKQELLALKDRTLHHRIYTLSPATCVNIRTYRIQKRKFRRKRGGRRKNIRPQSYNPRNVIKIKLHHKNSFKNVCENVKLATINTQSLKPKSAMLWNYIIDENIDISVLTETWLQSEDQLWIQTRDLNINQFRIQTVNRNNGRGSGLAIVYRKIIK